jgi:hypothetical protein
MLRLRWCTVGILLWVLLGLMVGAIAKYLMPGNAPGGIAATIILRSRCLIPVRLL